MHLDNFLIAEGRGLQKVQTNDNFARLLYVAEQKTIKAVAMRSKFGERKDNVRRACNKEDLSTQNQRPSHDLFSAEMNRKDKNNSRRKGRDGELWRKKRKRGYTLT